MSIHEDLLALAELVNSEEFKASKEAFCTKFCHEFVAQDVDESTANKLSYTQIHNKYIGLVEGEVATFLGQERLEAVLSGLEQYVSRDNHDKSEQVANALEILTSMADFEVQHVSAWHPSLIFHDLPRPSMALHCPPPPTSPRRPSSR